VSARTADRWSEPADLPWQVDGLINAAVVQLVAVALIGSGWYVAEHTAEASRAVLATNIAVGGLIVALAGNIAFLLSGLRTVGRLRRELVADLAQPAELDVPVREPAPADGLVAAEGMTRYHRPDCLLARRKVVVVRELAEHLDAGLSPCGVCRPDGTSP
jgi:hypothetical protein